MTALLTLTGHKSYVAGVSFSRDGRLLASAGYNDSTARVWDVPEGMEWHALVCGEGSTVSCVALAPDGKTLVASGTRPSPCVYVWDVESGKELAHWAEDSLVNAAAFAPDGSTFAVGLSDRKVKLFDTATRKVRFCLDEHNGSLSTLTFAPDSQVLASGDEGGEVRLWDVARGKLRIGPKRQENGVVGLAFAPDGKGLFIGLGQRPGGVRLWDVAGRKEVETFKPPAVRGSEYQDDVRHLAVSPDGKVLAVPIGPGKINFLDAATGALLSTVRAHDAYIWCVAFAPDGKTLASAGQEGLIKIWEVAAALK